MTYKIALYGFGSFPVVYRHLIEAAQAEHSPVGFCLILTAPNWRDVVRGVLPEEDVLDVFRELPRKPVGGDPALLSGYCGSLAEDLAALKRAYRKRTGAWLHARGIDFYCLYKNFLARRGATHLLMSNIESPDAKIAVAAAQELGVGIMAPMDLRNLSGSYFSIDSYETPPAYATVTSEARARAAEIIRDFRRQALPARNLPSDIDIARDDLTLLETYMPRFDTRAKRFVAVVLERPDMFDREVVRVSLMRNFGLVRNTIRGVRRWHNEKRYDIDQVGMLPRRFIYFPLQYTPEASINVPAPFFVDQFRVIDALRFAMPSDCTLVVKEHPACVEMRPHSFMQRVRKLPDVEVAKATMASNDLVKQAVVTVTVTGTAAFEAFLLGQPALALGRGLSAWMLGGVTSLGDIRSSIEAVIARPVPDQFVVDQVAKLINVRYPFFFATAHMAGEPMLRRGNIERFWAAIVDHLERERTAIQRAI